MKSGSHFARSQRSTIASAILWIVALIVILQLWLFTASMNALLGANYAILLPAALGSLGCLALNVGLLRYLTHLDR